MQTFMPYDDYKKSAECLDSKRLFKQTVEAKQIISILETGLTKNGTPYPDSMKHHPAVHLWKNHIGSLKEYYNICLEEVKNREINTTMRPYHYRATLKDNRKPLWINHNACCMYRGLLFQKNQDKYIQFKKYKNFNFSFDQLTRKKFTTQDILRLQKQKKFEEIGNIYREMRNYGKLYSGAEKNFVAGILAKECLYQYFDIEKKTAGAPFKEKPCTEEEINDLADIIKMLLEQLHMTTLDIATRANIHKNTVIGVASKSIKRCAKNTYEKVMHLWTSCQKIYKILEVNMPTPRKGEKEDSFIGRCVPMVLEELVQKNPKKSKKALQDQAVAICYTYWRDKDKK